MIAETKRALRAELKARLKGLSPEERAAASAAICARLREAALWREARTVALYAPLPSEVDVLPLADDPSRRVCFPLALSGDRRMRFASHAPGRPMKRGPLGVLEPHGPEVPLTEIELFVVPGLGFDRHGHRLGRGGGYYDVTLGAAGRAARIGVAFAQQLVGGVPHEETDALLDALVLPDRLLAFQRPR